MWAEDAGQGSSWHGLRMEAGEWLAWAEDAGQGSGWRGLRTEAGGVERTALWEEVRKECQQDLGCRHEEKETGSYN